MLKIHCNAGYLPGYGEVWLYVENILSLSRVEECYRVTYNSQNGNKFEVHLNNGLKQSFSQSKVGLYYCVALGHKKQPLTDNMPFEKDTILNTVEENKGRYSKWEVFRATLAQKIQKTLVTQVK